MGLRVNVYRAASGRDCTNAGESSRFENFTVVNVDGPFEPTDDAPAAILESHVRGCLRLQPVSLGDRLPMMGGNYAATSDSRWSTKCAALLGADAFYGAVAIHDRVEG